MFLSARLRAAILSFGVLTCLTVPAAGAEEGVQAETPVVVIELFTSQGCSSCPPADRLMEKLAVREDVIALSLPVDYWDYLGWKDTLALPGHTERQYAYARSHGESMVYTPQMVINGQLALNGAKPEEVAKALEHARAEAPLPGRAEISRDGGSIVISLQDMPAGDYTVWLLPLSSRAEVPIGRGENAGASIAYTNVPLTWMQLGKTSGEAMQEYRVSLADVKGHGADACAVIVQKTGTREEGNGPVVAAARLAL